MFNKKIVKFATSISMGITSFYVTSVLAAAGDENIGDIAGRVTGTLTHVVKLLTAGAYMAGFGLTIAALFKFKQHKDNPQQVQLGTCITMLLIGVCLIFLPSIIGTGGETIFGSTKESSGVGGTEGSF
jgi:intracellular multiplication protein IcmD